MGAKKPKHHKGEDARPPWQKQIEEAVLDEETCKLKVFVIDPAENEMDRLYLNKFELFAREEKRFVIKNISRTETIFMINQLGGETNTKDDKMVIFGEAERYLKEKKEIPSEIYALIIKHLIIGLKEEYLIIKRAKLEVTEGLRHESSIMLKKEELRNVKRQEIRPLQPTKNAPSVVADDSPHPIEGKKYNTTLRVRGEEWRDKTYVDDFPIDGPNLYVSVSGFLSPMLAGCLIKIGVPISAVIKIRIDPTLVEVPPDLRPASKRKHSEIDNIGEKTVKYWGNLQQIRLHRDNTDSYKDTAFIVYSPPYWTVDQLTGNPEQIYDEVCYLMYDVQDLMRQHKHYLKNMEIINVPEYEESSSLNKQYKFTMDDLPLECVTLFSLVTSIIETVCNENNAQHHDYESSSSETISRVSTDDIKVHKAKTLVRQVFNALTKSDCDKTYRVTYGDEYENQKDPIVINYGDWAKYKTFHLEYLDLNKAVETSLFCMPINKLWYDRNLPNEELEAKVDFHYNVLISCFDKDVDNAEINRLLQILACRKLYNNRSSLKKEHLPPTTIYDFKKSYLKRTKLAEPLTVDKSFARSPKPIPSPTLVQSEAVILWAGDSESENKRIKYLFECPDLSELVSAVEIATQTATESSHIIDNYEYFEDFCGVSALQIVHQAFNNYNCVNYKYCEVTDSFILMFFNSHDNDGISRHEWRSHLVTPVCLHDFFDFVLEEEYKWIQNEELIYDEDMKLKSLSLLKDSMDVIPKSCIENTDIATEMLIEGSLKYKDLQKMLENQSPNDPSTIAVSEKTDKTFTANESGQTSSKKSPKKLKGHKASLIKESEVKEDSLDVLLKEPLPFVGLDVSDRRVEVYGKDSTFFSKDGTKVNTAYILLIPSNLEYVSLNMSVGITNTEFWFYKALGEYTTNESQEHCKSFRISTKDQINIIIKKQEYKVPVTIVLEEPPTPKSKASTRSIEDLETIYETQSFNSFIQTWPNGLITESVYLDNSDQISHIKQYYTQKISNLEEEKRCISLNGEVIIFKTNNEIEVLRPDGTYILITKVGKNKIKTDAESITLSQPSKFTTKSRPRSKSSKKPTEDENKEDPLAQYEIFIEEFEVIGTNGSREKWKNDTGINVDHLIIRTATDYCIGEVFTRRMDGTNTLLNKDGLFIVTFPNNTRIITSYVIEDQEIFPEWTDEEIDYFQLFDFEAVKAESIDIMSQNSGDTTSAVGSNCAEQSISENKNDGYVSIHVIFTIEHANFASVAINKSESKITVNSINHVSLTVTTENQYNMSLDSATTAVFDGSNLYINYDACSECGSRTFCEVNVNSIEDIVSDKELSEEPKKWLKLKDSYDKKIYVSEEGTIFVDENSSSENIINDDIDPTVAHEEGEEEGDAHEEGEYKKEDAESNGASHDKCKNVYQNKSLRFFVLRRDLTCSELVHSSLVEEYKQRCRWQPWCSINEHDTFGDHRKYHSIILPLNLNESEKWLIDSKLADKPKYLTFKDLKKDEGKGFYHWMRPYERFHPKPKKPLNVLPPRQPRAFVLRTLEKQWDETNKNESCGAKAMINAILRYRRVLEDESDTLLTVPIREYRTEQEETVDQILYDLANRIAVDDLKRRLHDDLTRSVKPSITTKPLPMPDLEFHEEIEEELSQEKNIDDEQSATLNELNEAESISSALQKYWKRRADDYNEEQMYRHLLRDGTVPPYFQSVLGGEIWWEANNLVTLAANESERHKMMCPCAAEEEASTVTCKPK